MSWGSVISSIPGVNTAYDVAEGKWGDAAKNFSTGGLYGAAVGVGTGIKDGSEYLYDKAKNAINAPYNEKRAGYDAVIAQSQQIKQEDIDRQNAMYNLAEQKLAPARSALAAAYGDPSTWKL